MTQQDEPPHRIRPLNEIFTRGVTAMWATTYNIDLALFNEFLIGRLGDPPLNVVVLADQRRLALSLSRIPAERVDALAFVNRRWLLRDIRPGGLAFHPKTYLAVTGSRATLLVGSGNLSEPGLDSGKEVFTTFRSGTLAGDAALRTWTEWTRRLVEHTQDVPLAERFADLRKRLPAPESAPGSAAVPRSPGPLLHNLEEPIGGQFLAAVHSEARLPVDELLLTAPFYDGEAEAAWSLLDGLRPRDAHVYVASSTSVDGPRLAERLAASTAQPHLYSYEPDAFVHAKLVGVTAGADGWLLSGSANLSRAALTATSALHGGHGNVELCVLARLTADQVRAAFLPPDTVAVSKGLSALAPLEVHHDPDPVHPPVRLLSAAAEPDGRVAVVADGDIRQEWLLDDLISHQPLEIAASGRAITAGLMTGRLVRLAGPDRQPLSNHVVVDDPAGLRAVLTAGAGDRSDRPAELTGDDTSGPLGRGLLWLNRRLVMDVNEAAPASGSGGVAVGATDSTDDDGLWERLEHEQLARDYRAHAYPGVWGADSAGNPLIELLEILRDRAPAGPPIGSGSPLDELLARRRADGLPEDRGSQNDDTDDSAPRPRWKTTTRTRVRALNVLRRWAAAQRDPRLAWVDPYAPAGNFAAIASFLAGLRIESAVDPGAVELSTEDLDGVWALWLRSFAGSGVGDGWLDALAPEELAALEAKRPDWLPEAVAALSWLLVRPGLKERERLVQHQAVLGAARRLGLLEPSDLTARYLAAVTGNAHTRDQVADRLLRAETYLDDPLWCARTAQECSLPQVQIDDFPGSPLQVRLFVSGLGDPLRDPRLPRLLVAVRNYRPNTRMAVWDADQQWRLVFEDGEPVYYRSSVGPDQETERNFDPGVLTTLAEEGMVLSDLFPTESHVA